jgi:ketosteroid isomerase-like protein
MSEGENVERIQELYAAFGRGDVPTILSQLTDDAVLYDPGPPEVPHAGRYRGPEEVGQFFGRIAETVEIEEFAPTEFVAQGDRVVVLGSLRGRVKATGRSYDNEWAHVWTLRDGKVAGMQIYEDTARELAGHTA